MEWYTIIFFIIVLCIVYEFVKLAFSVPSSIQYSETLTDKDGVETTIKATFSTKEELEDFLADIEDYRK